METTPTVFVVDSDAAVAEDLRELARLEGWRIEVFGSAEDFLAAYALGRPGCLVTETALPGQGGLDLLDRLRAAGAGLPALVLTARPEVPAAVRALKAGAVDYLAKPCPAAALRERLEQMLRQDAQQRGERAAREETAARLALLTAREREVLDLVIAGRSNKDIAADLHISLKTVEAHRARIMAKTGAGNVADLVRQVMQAAGAPAPRDRDRAAAGKKVKPS